MKEIVTSTYSFERMINDDCVYVDKTAYLHKLVSAKESQYFISRPRRYGKSLMISTLKAIFEGRRELFEGLTNDEGAVKVAFVSFFYPMYNSRISSEKEMARGRIDAVWEDERNVYIFEFKYGKSAQEAFDQIVGKKYHLSYLNKGKRVVGVGLNWNPDKENRGLDDAVMMELKS